MRATGTFTVEAFTPIEPPLNAGPETGTPVAVATMEKRFAGDITGRSTTLFTYALDPSEQYRRIRCNGIFRGIASPPLGNFQLHALSDDSR